MKLLPNEWGVASRAVKVEKYEFNPNLHLLEPEEDKPKEVIDMEEDPEQIEKKAVEEKIKKEEEIIRAAKKEAEMIIAGANKLVEEIRKGALKEKEETLQGAQKQGYEAGFAEGHKAGQIQAKEEHEEIFKEERAKILEEIKLNIEEISNLREHFVRKYFNELCDLAMAIGEKVIKVSLKSSGKVIERMIVAATEKISNKQWANVHISGFDEQLLVEGDINLLESIQHISSNLKLNIMENEEPGTCIVELPDQIIDASVGAQLENIREIMEENRLDEDI